ncbi:MAG: hypothetical protein N2041_09505 [Tepidiforma sp.]|nr:hypothetical protein [Tepidiforma sp.]MCX7618158.1 hypothetical protein [Tepidiforma sp.]
MRAMKASPSGRRGRGGERRGGPDAGIGILAGGEAADEEDEQEMRGGEAQTKDYEPLTEFVD